MELYIVRHAWAEPRDSRQWPDDDRRPLTSAGRERFAAMTKMLWRRGMTPEAVATSPLTRCVETARILAAGRSEGTVPIFVSAKMGLSPLTRGEVDLVELDALWPGGDWEELLRWTAARADRFRKIAWVGHAPDVGCLTAALIGAGGGQIRFAKGAAAAIRFDGPPSLGGGELQWLATAKLLGY